MNSRLDSHRNKEKDIMLDSLTRELEKLDKIQKNETLRVKL